MTVPYFNGMQCKAEFLQALSLKMYVRKILMSISFTVRSIDFDVLSFANMTVLSH